MSSIFFITGTDTGVGKTLVTAALLERANRLKLTAYGIKPLAAGCEESEGGLRNDDALLLQQHSNVSMPYEQINPVSLRRALAPHIAAEEEHRTLSLDRLEGFCRGALSHAAQLKLIEGAGGWRVPLNARESMSGLPQRLLTPVILVVGMRLGCLNHALLTAEAIVRDGVSIAGWVANCVEPAMPALQENIATLRHLLPAPLLGCIPWQKPVNVVAAADCLRLPSELDEGPTIEL